MDNGGWSVTLEPGTSTSVLDQVDARTYMFSTLAVTPVHLDPAAVSATDLLAASRYSGVLLDMSDDRRVLSGDGLAWWLGNEDSGDLYQGVDSSSGAGTFSVRFSNNVVAYADGLSLGSVVDATTGTMKLGFVDGTTRRQTLDTLCDGFGDEWRINPAGSIDADDRATLFASNGVVLTQEGGRDGTITGLAADLSIDRISGREYRTAMYTKWNDGSDDGVATQTPPSTWKNFAGGTLTLASVIDAQPRGRIRGRRTVAKIAAWIFQNQTRASVGAASQLGKVATYEYTINAEIDEYDPWRFLKIGDTVYVYDLETGVLDAATEVYYRGEAIHPDRIRAVSWETPILEGYGVYLVRSGYGSGDIFDLTPYVQFEDTTTSIELSTTARYHRRRTHQRRFTHRQALREARRIRRLERIADYVQAVSR